jgi:hypothetical protein
MNNNKKWTRYLLDELSKDYGLLSKNDIENKYKCSWNSIRTICSKFKIKTNRNKTQPCCPIKYTKIRDMEAEFIKDWVENILTTSELIEKYECPYTNIKTRARFYNIKRKKLKEKININELVQDYINKMSIFDIVLKYNISHSTIIQLTKGLVTPRSSSEVSRKYYLHIQNMRITFANQ